MTAASPPQSSKHGVVRGAFWRFVEALGGECIALLVFVSMAHLLAPESFGLIALAAVIVSGCQVTLYGIAEAVVQGGDLTTRRFTTAFWCNLGLGSLLVAAVCVLAPGLAALFGDPDLVGVLMALSLTLPVAAAAAIIQARLMRRMAFGPIACRALVAACVGGVIGLGLALAGAGIWALVGLQLGAAIGGLATLLIAERWLPRLLFDRAEAGSLLRFSLPLLGTSLARFAGQKLDIAILGLFVTTTALGHYMLAARLILTLGLVTHVTICTLSLPVLSRLAGQPEAFRQTAGRVLWFAVASCLPAGLGVASVVGLLVPVVFGPAWEPSVAPMQVLAASIVLPALGLISGQILVAAGQPKRLLGLALMHTALFLTLVALAAPFGLTSAAIAGALANALMLPAYAMALKHGVRLAIGPLLRDLLPLFLAAAVMVASVLAVELYLNGHLPAVVLLPLSILAGGISYLASLWLFASEQVRQVVRSLDLHLALSWQERILAVGHSMMQWSIVRRGRAAAIALAPLIRPMNR